MKFINRKKPMLHSHSRTRLLAIATTLLLLSACSTMQLTYNTANWWFGWVIDDIIPITLDKSQRRQVKQEFRQLHQWHRDTQLTQYADYIDSIAADMSGEDSTGDNLDIALLQQREQEAEQLINRIVEQIIPFIAQLAGTLNHEQTAEFLHNSGFKIDQSKIKKTKKTKKKSASKTKQTPQQRKEALRKRLIKLRQKQILSTAKKWLGSVSDQQRQMVSEWSDQAPLEEDYTDPEWQKQQDADYQERKQRFIDLLENQRMDTAAVERHLRKSWHSDIYTGDEKEQQLKVDLIRSISPKQQRHLQKKLAKLSKTLRKISRQ